MKTLLLLTLAMGLLVGCQKDQESALNPDGTTNLSSVVFARFNNTSLTAAEVRDTVLILARIAELSKKPIKEKQFPQWANRKEFHLIPSLISAKLLEKEARRVHTVVSDDDIAKELAKYNKMTKQKARTLDELAPLFGDLEQPFRKQFERECLFVAFFRANPDLRVTDDDIATYFQAATNQLNWATKTNRDAVERGNKIYERLKSGEDWNVVAKETTEDALLDKEFADNWKNWVDAPLTAVEFEGVRTNVSALAVGEFTKPIETEEGLVIVKLLGHEGDLYHCARILLRMACDVEIPSREKAVRELEQEKNKDYQLALLADLREKAKIEYPMGKKITFKIWPEAERPRKAKNFNFGKPKKSLMEQTSEAAQPTENKKEEQTK